MIFFVLTTLILIDSNGLPANSIKNRQEAENDSADNINYSNERLNSFVKSEVNNSKESTETRKIPTCLNQETTGQCKNEEISTSTEKNYQYLINALSKIANVRYAQEDSVVTRQHSMFTMTRKIYLCICRVSTSIRGPTSSQPKLSSKPNSEDTFNDTLNDELRRRNFHCHAIQDIYIPEMKEKIPSYVCTFGENLETFILSSKRFFQDHRNNLRINIDNDILRKLSNSAITPTNSQFKIIPAALVLKHQHENYYIRNPQNFYD